MLWKKAQPTITIDEAPRRLNASARPTSPSGTAQEDAAIDTVVAILRTLGRQPMPGTDDAADVGLLFDAWATHLAVGGPHPDARPVNAVEARGRDNHAPAVERDWAGARRFVQEHRERECAQVTGTVSASRALVWEVADRLTKTIAETRARDEDLVEQLAALRAAIATGSLSEIQQEVDRVATVVTEAVQEREQQFQVQLAEMGSRVANLSEQLQDAKTESSLDGLTRIANRAAFDSAIRRWHYVASRFGRPAVLIMADLDRLKTINDENGHRAGDAALRTFADCLVRAFPRRSDFVGRYGGDEFVVLLAETTAELGLRLAERFRQGIRSGLVEVDGRKLALSASIGLAQVEPGESIESWIDRADQALYQAKQAGRDQVAWAQTAA